MILTLYIMTSLLASTGCLLYDIFDGRLKRVKKTRYEYLESFFRALPNALFNLVVVTGLVCKFYEYFVFDRDNPCQLNFLLQYIIVFVFTDFAFYVMHRLFHQKIVLFGKEYNLYLIHKQHHEFVDPIGLSAYYAHPLDYLFANLLPLSIPIAIMNPPEFLLYQMIVFGVLKSVVWGHGDYKFTRGFHEAHHRTFNFNYGSDRVFDWLFGTLHPSFGGKLYKIWS